MLLTVLWYAKDELDTVLFKDFTIWRGRKTDDSEILHVMREEIQVCAECWGSPEGVEHRSSLWGRSVPSNQLQVVEIQPKTASFPVLIPDGGEGMRGFISSLYALLICLHFVLFRAYFMTNSETLWKATPTNFSMQNLPWGYTALLPHPDFWGSPGWAPASSSSWNKRSGSGVSIR